MLFHVFSWQNSRLNISFYLVEIQPLNQVDNLKNTQFHEDLMLFSLDNGRGTLTTTLVNSKRVVISLQRPKTSQLPTMVMVNHEGPRHFTISQALASRFQ